MVTAFALLRRFWFAIPILALAAALLATRGRLADVKAELGQARAFIGMVVTTVRDAIGSPDVQERDVPLQIAALGNSLATVNHALETCNGSARAAAARDAALQRDAAAELARVTDRVHAQAAQIDRLKASAARPRTAGEACQVSEEVRRAWR